MLVWGCDGVQGCCWYGMRKVEFLLSNTALQPLSIVSIFKSTRIRKGSRAGQNLACRDSDTRTCAVLFKSHPSLSVVAVSSTYSDCDVQSEESFDF